MPVPRPQEEEELIINHATAWQLPPDGDDGCNETAVPEVLNATSRQITAGSYECHSFFRDLPQRNSNMVLQNADEPKCVTRPRADSWPGCSPHASLLRSDSDGEIKNLNLSRPFLSLMLPEWVHEKAEEDEAAGAFRCRSLISLNTASPTNSSVASPMGSRASSPSTSPWMPTKAESHPRSGRRSGVCRADLADDSDEETLSGSFISSTAADSLTDSSAGSLASSRASSPCVPSFTKPHEKSARWADLYEYEEDPNWDSWCISAAASKTNKHLFVVVPVHACDWPNSEGPPLQIGAALVQ